MPRVARAAPQEQPAAQPVTRVAPVRSRRQDIDIVEGKTGRARVLKSVGPAKEALENGEVEVALKMPSASKAAALAFMEEKLTIMIHDSDDPNAEPLPEVINGGDKARQYFERGREQLVRRKYVEVLIRARKTTYTQEKYTDRQGIEAYRNIPHSVPRFPFSIIDDSPKGRAYWKAIEETYRAQGG